MASGNYKLVVKVDETNAVPESNENNNAATHSQSIEVTRGFVDLSGRFISETLPSTVAENKRLRGVVRVRVTNSPANVPLPLGQRVNVSLVARSTTGDTLLATARNQPVSRLGPGLSRTVTIRVNKSDGLPRGDYDLVAFIGPIQPLTEEQTENNEVTINAAGDTYRLSVI